MKPDHDDEHRHDDATVDESPTDWVNRVVLRGTARELGEAAPPDPFIGMTVGDILIEAVVGEGGMGRVYRGRQDRPRRTVAVKIMKPGLLSPDATRRFEREAEVLGSLRHPGIATVHTAGVHHVAGIRLPYIVMEFIPDARTFTAHADVVKLGVRERLQLFLEVCEAVAHGHERGVVHRDLKPSNILVDSAGRPKVIDFGIALAAGSDLATTTIQAVSGQLLGTLQYMSPAQFRGVSDLIDARTDVYSLGVVLYELLTGQMPHDLAGKPIYEVARAIAHDPARPLHRLNARLSKDITAVAATCIDQDAARRYACARELGDDVARHLRGEPVHAKRLTVGSVLIGTARRNRRRLAAALATVALAAIAARVWPNPDLRNLKYLAELRHIDAQRNQRDMAQAEAALAAIKRPVDGTDDPIELRCLKAELDEAAVTLRGHEKHVTDVAYSPNGALVASAAADGTIRIWSTADGTETAILRGHGGPVLAVCFDPSGERLASGSEDRTARVWRLDREEPPTVLSGHDRPITGIAFAPDGGSVLTMSQDKTVRHWDVATGMETTRATITDPARPFNHARFSPDGTLVVTCSREFGDNAPLVWETSSGRLVATLKGHKQRAWDIAFSPDGRRLATAADDRTIKMWSADDWACIDTLVGHEAWVTAAAFSPNGQRLATTSGDKTVRLWDVATGDPILSMVGHSEAPAAVRFDPNNRFVASGGHDASVRLWDLSANTEPTVLAMHQRPLWGIAVSSDGSRIATGSEDCMARIVDATTLEVVASWKPHQSTCSGLAFSPDGETIATCSWDGAAAIWDATSQRRQRDLVGHGQHIWSIAFSPDGTRIATASGDRTARLWNVATGATTAILKGHGDGVRTVAFSPDGKRVATSSWDKTARVWDATTGTELLVLRGHTALVRSVAFNADGALLATASDDKTVMIRDSSTGEVARSLNGHARAVWDASFTPDGRRVVTAGEDHTARIWNAATGDELLVLEGHRQPVSGLRIGPDGSWFVTVSHDRTARVWGLPNATVHAARAKAAAPPAE
ncbi:MAG: protein kinase domain-containing protein [Planctomycetaceae bacterium]